MAVTSDGKWFWVDPPTGAVGAAAQQILSLRMDDVQRFLPLAARHDADDVEYVHQLRVSCRRAAAALRAFEPLLGRGGRKLKRWLKRLRQAAGPARDADVYLARLRTELDPASDFAQQLADLVAQSRDEAQAALVRIETKAARGGLQRAVDKCLSRLERTTGKLGRQSFREFAEQAVTSAVDGLDVVDAQTASLAELHLLRIAAKRLRYSIEIFHSAAAPDLRVALYPQIEEIQERLGAINDRTSSQGRLQRWLAGLPADGLAAFAASLIVSEHALAEGLRRDFLAQWGPERDSQLRDGLTAAFSS